MFWNTTENPGHNTSEDKAIGEPSSQLAISQVFICYDMTNYAT